MVVQSQESNTRKEGKHGCGQCYLTNCTYRSRYVGHSSHVLQKILYLLRPLQIYASPTISIQCFSSLLSIRHKKVHLK